MTSNGIRKRPVSGIRSDMIGIFSVVPMTMMLRIVSERYFTSRVVSTVGLITARPSNSSRNCSAWSIVTVGRLRYRNHSFIMIQGMRET